MLKCKTDNGLNAYGQIIISFFFRIIKKKVMWAHDPLP